MQIIKAIILTLDLQLHLPNSYLHLHFKSFKLPIKITKPCARWKRRYSNSGSEDILSNPDVLGINLPNLFNSRFQAIPAPLEAGTVVGHLTYEDKDLIGQVTSPQAP